jgi:plasmid stability protein
MATLHVRSVPEDLYERIQRLAQSRSRSLSAEVITLLYQALEVEENRKRQGKLLADVRRRRFTPPSGTPDSVELLREDRRR